MDAYDLKARLSPVALVAAPGSVLSGVLFSSPDWWRGVVATVGVGALHYFLAQIVRDKGAVIQEKMWAQAGGSPTVRMLYLTSVDLDEVTKWRRREVERATGVELPRDVIRPGAGANHKDAYHVAVARLRDLTRSTEWTLIRAENANYGFRRNMLGCRTWGLWVAAIVAILSLAMAFFGDSSIVAVTPSSAVLCALLSSAWWFVWLRAISADFVELASRRYAEALLAAAPLLPTWGQKSAS